jgi:hypothetical protein
VLRTLRRYEFAELLATEQAGALAARVRAAEAAGVTVEVPETLRGTGSAGNDEE